MRIDLRCHTKEIKEGDKGRDITAESFARKMSDNLIQVIRTRKRLFSRKTGLPRRLCMKYQT